MYVILLLLFFLSFTCAAMFAQEYPTKPVRMIEPFGAGGGVDVIARILSTRLSEIWGQPVTVENALAPAKHSVEKISAVA